jgi:hypothetical protein
LAEVSVVVSWSESRSVWPVRLVAPKVVAAVSTAANDIETWVETCAETGAEMVSGAVSIGAGIAAPAGAIEAEIVTGMTASGFEKSASSATSAKRSVPAFPATLAAAESCKPAQLVVSETVIAWRSIEERVGWFEALIPADNPSAESRSLGSKLSKSKAFLLSDGRFNFAIRAGRRERKVVDENGS